MLQGAEEILKSKGNYSLYLIRSVSFQTKTKKTYLIQWGKVNFSAQEAKNERNYLHLKLNNNVIFKVQKYKRLLQLEYLFHLGWLLSQYF